MNLRNFKDALARAAYNMTAAEAHAQGVCIGCKRDMSLVLADLKELEIKEYQISGLCPTCFEEATR